MNAFTTQPYWLTPGPRSAVEFAKDQARFWRGYVPYLAARRNDWGAFYAFRRLFCATDGRFNDALVRATRPFSRPYPVDAAASLIPGLTPGRQADIVRALDRDGVYVFQDRVPDAVCDGLTGLAERLPTAVMGADGKCLPDRHRIDLRAPKGIKYDAPMEDIVCDPVAQRVAADPGLLAVAQGYFRAKAVQDLVAMWWSLPAGAASSAAAQLYHFDMDRIKFLKFFLYLSDVGPDNGPHCFVRGTHRRLPKPLRQDKRHTDDEVFRHLPRDRELVITGRKGTLVAEDTRGLHKGLPLAAGHRLIFQVEFALNLFGMHYPHVPLGDAASPYFRAMMARYPYTFAAYAGGPAPR